MPWVNGELVLPGQAPSKKTTPPKPKPKAPAKVDIGNTIDRLLGPNEQAHQLSPAAARLGDMVANSAIGRFGGTAISKGMNLLETPFTMLGASVEGAAKGENPFPNLGPHNGTTTAEAAQQLIASGQLGKAAQRYSMTSPYANNFRAAAGVPGADYFKRHPKQFALAAGTAEIANPGNILAGEATGLTGGLLRTGARVAERAATATAKAAGSGIPAENVVSRALRGAQGGGGRFGELVTAAQRTNPKSATRAGRAANLHGTNIANAPGYGLGRAQEEVTHQFKGMTPDEKLEFVDRLEYPGRTFTTFDPAGEARINRAVALQKQYNIARDARLVKFGIAQPHELLNPETFVTRKGSTLDPNAYNYTPPGMEPFDEAEWAAAHGSKTGGGGVRRGTLATNRTHSTRRASLLAGNQMDPEWDVAQAELWRRAAQERSIRIEESLQALQHEAPGLIVPKSIPTGRRWLTKRGTWAKQSIQVPRPPGYAEFTKAGDTRTYGAPTLRNAYVHPSVRDLIGDITPDSAIAGVSGLGPVASKTADAANRAALGLYTGNILFHGGVNLPGNVLRELLINRTLDPGELLKTLFSKEGGVAAGEKAGASIPYASKLPLETQLGRTQDLPTRFQRGKARVGQALESINSGPLFGKIKTPKVGPIPAIDTPGIEPRLASATYAAALKKNLKAGMTEPEARAAAVDTARGVVGEPEKVPKWAQSANHVLPFVGWRRSQLMRWPLALAKNPQLFMGVHKGIQAYNASRGRGEGQNDANSFIPPIEWNKGGGTTKFATPADWAVGLLNAAASGDAGKLATKAVYDTTPILSLAARAGATAMAPQVNPTTPLGRQLENMELWKPGSKPGDIAKQAALSTAQQYSPARQFTLPALVGVENAPDKNPATVPKLTDAQKPYARIAMKLESQAGFLESKGYKKQADRLRHAADALLARGKISHAAFGKWQLIKANYEEQAGAAEAQRP